MPRTLARTLVVFAVLAGPAAADDWPQWRTPLGTLFKNSWSDGPRGTPTVAGGRVHALG